MNSIETFRLIFVWSCAVLVAAPCAAQQASDSAILPPDVTAFIARRDLCDHFREEDRYDAARAAQIDRQLRRTCTGTDTELARLKRLHATEPAVKAALSRYEPSIE